MVPQPRVRNRFALLPRFGSYANLFLPLGGDDASETGTLANFSSALQMTLPIPLCVCIRVVFIIAIREQIIQLIDVPVHFLSRRFKFQRDINGF